MTTRDEADRFVTRLLERPRVRVYHAPRSPHDSVLVTGPSSSANFLLIFAVVWLTFVLGMAVLMWSASLGAGPEQVEHVEMP